MSQRDLRWFCGANRPVCDTRYILGVYKEKRTRFTADDTMSNQRVRNWCFTINNFNDVDVEALHALASHPDVRYICIGDEVGDEGTKHLQGYIEMRGPSRFNAMKEKLGGSRVHLEARRGTAKQAAEYCQSEWAPAVHLLHFTAEWDEHCTDLANALDELDTHDYITIFDEDRVSEEEWGEP